MRAAKSTTISRFIRIAFLFVQVLNLLERTAKDAPTEEAKGMSP